MSIRRRRSRALAAQTVDLAFAVPQVVAHRVARMAAAGTNPSARDRRELYRMGTEKISALNEAWSSMALETWLANQRFALSFMQSLWFPWLQPKSRANLSNAALDILASGVTPIRRRAVTNAKRLGRSRRRR